MFLLDTNACIRILNNSSPPLIANMQKHTPDEIFLCAVVKAELTFGAYHSTQVAENLRVLAKFFEPFVSLPFDDACVMNYGRIRAELTRQGTIIGPYDLMIAATAVTHNLTLITHNTREFERVAGLMLEDWEI
ncbi:MAG: type II toxin-antitoxin system VapC family toxin [Anaerolineae bacterium]